MTGVVGFLTGRGALVTGDDAKPSNNRCNVRVTTHLETVQEAKEEPT